MNNLDKQYQALLQDILDNGTQKGDRTGTGTISVFGRQIRHNMKEGFPLITTKKMPFKTIAIELIWFLKGDTNIKFLVDNGCNIWNGDAYKNYFNNVQEYEKLPNENDVKSMTMVMDSQGNLHPSSIRFTMEEFIERIKTNDAFAKKWGELGPVYGKQWRKWKTGEKRLKWNQLTEYEQKSLDEETINNMHLDVPVYNKEIFIDQIRNLVEDLRNNPDSRRLMVNAWNVGEIDQMVLPPCHYGFQLYTRELSQQEKQDWWFRQLGDSHVEGHPNYDLLPKRAISLIWNQRSVDTFLGLPFNIASYGLLLEILAKEVNMVPDELIGNLGDTHLYSNHLGQAKEQIERESFDLPNVNVNDSWKFSSSSPVFADNLKLDMFELVDYKSHGVIKAPLSN